MIRMMLFSKKSLASSHLYDKSIKILPSKNKMINLTKKNLASNVKHALVTWEDRQGL